MYDQNETENREHLRKTLVWISLATIVIYFISMALSILPFVERSATPAPPSKIAMFSGFALNAFIWILLAVMYLPQLPFRGMKKTKVSTKVGVLFTCFGLIFLALLFFTGVNILLKKFLDYTPEIQDIAKQISTSSSKEIFLLILTPVTLIPIVEEILFRGLLYRSIKEHTKPVYAAILSAAIFALVHMEPQAMPQLFVLALIFAYAYEKTGSLVVPALLHASNNLLAVGVLLSSAPV